MKVSTLIRTTFLALTLQGSFNAFSQSQIYLNDVFYDRIFRTIIVKPTGIRDTTIRTNSKIKLNLYQKAKFGFEAIPSLKGYPAFGVVGSTPVYNRINIDFGFMAYKRPFEDIPNTDNFAWTGSVGASFYSKYAKIYAGGMYRWGNAPILEYHGDTMVWRENIRTEVNPYLYYELPISGFSLATNVMPSADYKTLAKLGLYAAVAIKGFRQLSYVDRMKTPVGFDYDGGLEVRYIFKDGTIKDKKERDKRLVENAFMKVRVGNAFRINTLKGEKFDQKIDDPGNRYALFELGYYWMAGVCYHETKGIGWRVGVDYGVKNYRIIATYQQNYIMPIAFANQINQGNLYLSIRGEF